MSPGDLRGTFLLCHPVYVMCKSFCCTTEISLHGFHVIAILEGEDGRGVSVIVYTTFRCVDPCGYLFIVEIYNFQIERFSGLRRKDKGGFLFFCVLVSLLQTVRFKTLFELLYEAS